MTSDEMSYYWALQKSVFKSTNCFHFTKIIKEIQIDNVSEI